MKTTEDRLIDSAARGESETQELRASTGQRSEATKAICAMLNHKGGRVIFGVDAKGRVVGQEVTDKTVEDVAAYLRMIEPPAFPSVERIPVSKGREAIVVSVERGSRHPAAEIAPRIARAIAPFISARAMRHVSPGSRHFSRQDVGIRGGDQSEPSISVDFRRIMSNSLGSAAIQRGSGGPPRDVSFCPNLAHSVSIAGKRLNLKGIQ